MLGLENIHAVSPADFFCVIYHVIFSASAESSQAQPVGEAIVKDRCRKICLDVGIQPNNGVVGSEQKKTLDLKQRLLSVFISVAVAELGSVSRT
jgi:hypothetical protein